MKLTSPAFENYESIPPQYTCDGDSTTPPLDISELPENTKSLVLIVEDPDAPAGLFTHWIVWNINPETTIFRENKLPLGAVEGQNSSGTIGYFPPCPPSGVHHYRFKLVALSDKLEMNSGDNRDDVEAAMAPLIIDRAELVGAYSREYPEDTEL